MNAFVTDTHPLVYFAGSRERRLGRKALAAFRAFEAGQAVLYVPATVVLETWLLALGGRLPLRGSLARWWQQMEGPGLVHVELTAADVLAAGELDWDHKDVFDRLIVACALRLDLPLITGDAAITDWAGVPIHW
jgi:PIN domain nuclease of toxin-antitoxin system